MAKLTSTRPVTHPDGVVRGYTNGCRCQECAAQRRTMPSYRRSLDRQNARDRALVRLAKRHDEELSALIREEMGWD